MAAAKGPNAGEPLVFTEKTIGKKGGGSYFLCSWCIMYTYRIICIDISYSWKIIDLDPQPYLKLPPAVSHCFIFGPLQLQGVCVRGELSMSAKLPGVRINGLAWGKIYRKPWILHDLPIILGGILQFCPPKNRKKGVHPAIRCEISIYLFHATKTFPRHSEALQRITIKGLSRSSVVSQRCSAPRFFRMGWCHWCAWYLRPGAQIHCFPQNQPHWFSKFQVECHKMNRSILNRLPKPDQTFESLYNNVYILLLPLHISMCVA